MSSHACCSELQERSYFSLTHSMSATDGGAWPASHLTITVLQARRLRPKNRQGGSNPYVQVQLGNHSFTTQHACNTLCPVWNDAMIFALPTPQDDAMAMTLTVMHRRLLAALPDKFLGRVEIRLVDVCRDHQPGNRKLVTDSPDSDTMLTAIMVKHFVHWHVVKHCIVWPVHNQHFFNDEWLTALCSVSSLQG